MHMGRRLLKHGNQPTTRPTHARQITQSGRKRDELEHQSSVDEIDRSKRQWARLNIDSMQFQARDVPKITGGRSSDIARVDVDTNDPLYRGGDSVEIDPAGTADHRDGLRHELEQGIGKRQANISAWPIVGSAMRDS